MTEQITDTNKTTILAFDTALGGVSVGVITKDGHVVSRMAETTRGQAAMLVPMIMEVLEEGESSFDNIDAITCTIGPGSFTGLRIGLTTARTLSMTLNKPLVGLNTLDVMARHYPAGQNMLIVLETKRQDFYGCYYDATGQAVTEAFALDAASVVQKAPFDNFLVGGDCLKRFQEVFSEDLSLLDSLSLADPILIAQMGLERLSLGTELPNAQPLYLRGADVSMPKVAPRVLEQES